MQATPNLRLRHTAAIELFEQLALVAEAGIRRGQTASNHARRRRYHFVPKPARALGHEGPQFIERRHHRIGPCRTGIVGRDRSDDGASLGKSDAVLRDLCLALQIRAAFDDAPRGLKHATLRLLEIVCNRIALSEATTVHKRHGEQMHGRRRRFT